MSEELFLAQCIKEFTARYGVEPFIAHVPVHFWNALVTKVASHPIKVKGITVVLINGVEARPTVELQGLLYLMGGDSGLTYSHAYKLPPVSPNKAICECGSGNPPGPGHSHYCPILPNS